MTDTRTTKYSLEVQKFFEKAGHASNAEVLYHLKNVFRDVSATTTHRITARLHERGVLGSAPSDRSGCMRYDSTTRPHDHFVCDGCDGIRDLDVSSKLLPTINDALGGCKVTGNLIIHGYCEKCINTGEKS